MVLESVRLPYYDLTSHKAAFVYPFFHAIQLLLDAARFVYGAFFLVGALATLNFTAAGNVASGMSDLFFAAALEVCNIAFSIVGLATRLVASVLNFGYVSFSKELLGCSMYDHFTVMLADDQLPKNAFNLVM